MLCLLALSLYYPIWPSFSYLNKDLPLVVGVSLHESISIPWYQGCQMCDFVSWSCSYRALKLVFVAIYRYPTITRFISLIAHSFYIWCCLAYRVSFLGHPFPLFNENVWIWSTHKIMEAWSGISLDQQNWVAKNLIHGSLPGWHLPPCIATLY